MESIQENNKFSRGGVRSSNIELFRILSMLMIVAHHYVVNSGLLNCIENQQTHEIRDYILLLIGWGGKTGINCFVFITGWFMCKSHISVKKFIKLLAEVEFYSVTIYTVFLFSGYQTFTIKSLMKAVFPFYDLSTGFTSCFLLFYLLIPYFNTLIQALQKKEHLKLILLLLFIYTVLPTFIKTTVVFNYITWFSIVYIVAAYIRLYPKKWYSDNYTVSICLIVSVILSWISVVVLAFICFKTGKEIQNCYYFVSDSNKLLALSTAVFSFLFFDNIKMKYHKFINVVAASTFGVLQIHTSSDTMRTWLWKTVCDNVGAYDTSHWLLHVVVCIVMVFCVCTLIDIVRINILEIPFLEWLNKKMADNRMERY